MKTRSIQLLAMMMLLCLASCKNNKETDTQQPAEQINAQANNSDPQDKSKFEDIKKYPDNTNTDLNQKGDGNSMAEKQEGADNHTLRPFKFTIDLEKYYQQSICDLENGNCQSYAELKREPEIIIHIADYPDAEIHYDIDCDGDGIYEQAGVKSHSSCKYNEKTGKHQISLRGKIPGLVLCGDNDEDNWRGFSNAKAVVSIEQWGDIQWKTMHEFFANCTDFKILAKEAPNLSDVTDMSNMFQGAETFNQSIEHWDVSHVTNMSNLFAAAFEFNQPLAKWDVSHVTSMLNMFLLARAFNQPLNTWKVDEVSDMSGMFTEASAFNQPLTTWNVSHVTSMDGMFRGASAFNQPLESWDVSHVTNMGGMFNRASSFNQPLAKWDVSHVRTMNAMFWGASAFRQNIDAWTVNSLQDMQNMFHDSGTSTMPKWFHEK